MSRRKHTDAGERVASLKAIRAELAASYDLAVDDPRITQAGWIKLGQANWERQILLGKPVSISELQPFTDTIISLLGSKPTTLNVHFVEKPRLCAKCQGELPPESEPEAPEPVKAERPAPSEAASGPAPRAPAQANVVALHKDIHAGAQHK